MNEEFTDWSANMFFRLQGRISLEEDLRTSLQPQFWENSARVSIFQGQCAIPLRAWAHKATVTSPPEF